MKRTTLAFVAAVATAVLMGCVAPVVSKPSPKSTATTKPTPPATTTPVVTPPPTFTYTIVNTGGDNVKRRLAPAVAAAWNGLAPPGATVGVICQRFVASEPMGSFGNTLWFNVNGAGLNGWWINDTFTSSPHLAADKTVGVPGIPFCATSQPPPSTAADRAAAEAMARVGQTQAGAGDLALFSAAEWAPGPVGEWAGDCPKLPYAAWYHATGGAVRIQKGNAINNFNYYNSRGLIRGGVPPVGAVTFYAATASNANLGHTAISVGGGNVATTTGLDGAGSANAIRPYNSVGGGAYLGYFMP